MRPRFASLVITLGLVSNASAQPAVWDGDAGDGLWTSADNWDPDQVPSLSSLVDIPSDAGQVTLILSSATIASINCLSSFRLDSASIGVGGTSSVMNLVVVGIFNPTITAGGVFTISGASSAVSLTIEGQGPFTNAGVFDAFSVGVDNSSVINEGAWNAPMSSSQIALNGTSTFSNTGTITLTDNSEINGTGALSNSGTISRAGGAGIASISAPFTQTGGSLRSSGVGATLTIDSTPWSITGGTITVLQQGTIDLAGSNSMMQTRTIGPVAVSGTGSFRVFPGNSTIDWLGESTIGVTGTGSELYSGTLNIAQAIRNSGIMEARGTTLSGTGTFTNTAPGNFSVPIGNALNISTTFNNRGTLTNNATIFLDNNASLNHTNGTIELREDSFFSTLTPLATGEIRTSALVRHSPINAGGIAVIETPYTALQGSQTHSENGVLVLRGGGTFSNTSFTFGGSLTGELLRIQGDPSITYTVPEDAFFIDPKNGNEYAVAFGDLISSGPTLSIAGNKILANNVVTLFNGAETTGPGDFRNAGGMLWNGGIMGSAFTSISPLIIPNGAAPVLTGPMVSYFTTSHSGYLEINAGSIDNQGDWTMKDSATLAAGTTPGLFTNNAQLVVDDPAFGSHLFSASLSNLSTVEAKRGHIFFTGDVTQFDRKAGDLNGGLWIATEPNSSISFNQAMLQLSDGVILRGGSVGFPEIGTLERVENGAIALLHETLVNGPLVNDAANVTADVGDVTINGDYTGTGGSQTTVMPGSSIESTGTIQIGDGLDSAADDINPIVTIARLGTASPSIVANILDLFDTFTINGSGSGFVFMTGDLFMRPSATLKTHFANANTSDKLSVTGHATIDGTLEVELLGETPAFGEQFLIMSTTSGVSGTINDVVVTGADPIFTFVPEIIGNNLWIVATSTCAADLDNTGSLDFSDASTFLTYFANGDLRADFDDSGSLDFGDVSAFLTLFANGCP